MALSEPNRCQQGATKQPRLVRLLPLEPVADDGTDNAGGLHGVVGGVLLREDHVVNRARIAGETMPGMVVRRRLLTFFEPLSATIATRSLVPSGCPYRILVRAGVTGEIR